jgi:hypothetical protein
MDEDDAKPKPQPPIAGAAKISPEKLAQKQRLAEELRANLRRRKAQARGRKAGGSEEAGS